MIYRAPRMEDALTQGDILYDCPLVYWESLSSEVETEPRPVTVRTRVVVLTQACDLVQSKATRVLVAVVHEAQNLVDRGILKSNVIRDQQWRAASDGWSTDQHLPPATTCPFPLCWFDFISGTGT